MNQEIIMPDGSKAEDHLDTSLGGKQCGGCRYWRLNASDMKTGMCKRFPPGIFAVPVGMDNRGQVQIQVNAMFPGMQKNDGCGEWVGRDTPTMMEKLLGFVELFFKRAAE